MARVYVSVGSNIDAPRNVRSAVAGLRQAYAALIVSPVYESEAVGFAGDNFLNLVVGFDTGESVTEVARRLRAIEDDHARDRDGPRFSARTLDLDLLLYDDVVIDDGSLQLPRGEITQNAFVLAPLADVAPDLRHPLTKHTYAELWRRFDKAKQSLWVVEFQWDALLA